MKFHPDFVLQPPALQRLEPKPASPLNVMPSHLARGTVLAVHSGLAAKMTAAKLPVNAFRLRHFAWLDRAGFEVMGWGGVIDAIEPIDEGSLVTLVVAPNVTVRGGGATVADMIYEKYALLNDGTFRFVDAAPHPAGEAGSYVTD